MSAPKEVSRESFEKEYYYHTKVLEQSKSFEELLSRFPADNLDPKILETLHMANSRAVARDPSFVLDPEVMRELKMQSPEIFAQISPVYQQFLAEKAGIK